MSIPVQITFRNVSASPFVRARVGEQVERLSRRHPRLLDCRVVVEAPHRHHHKGKLYAIAIELRVPGANLAAHRNHDAQHAHEDIYVALRDAFDAAERQLHDYFIRKGAA
jgi:ribosome-associated translation inhibitor RaiA